MGAEADLTCDGFLGGQIRLWQPKHGYRAGVDPVLLAASVPARAGQSVLDVGCGVGAAMFCLGARVPAVTLTGLELQPDYAELARRNAQENGIDAQIHCGDIRAMPAALKNLQFDHVITNPPYYPANAVSPTKTAGRRVALAEDVALSDWLDQACKRLAPRGYLTLVQRADRLGDVLSAIPAPLGGVQIQPIAPRADKDASLVLVQARKGSNALARLAAPIVMHKHATHQADTKDYADEIDAVLRQGEALPIWKV